MAEGGGWLKMRTDDDGRRTQVERAMATQRGGGIDHPKKVQQKSPQTDIHLLHSLISGHNFSA
jgi:hypothetical protein